MNSKRLWRLVVPAFALIVMAACSGGEDSNLEDGPVNNDVNMETPAGVDEGLDNSTEGIE